MATPHVTRLDHYTYVVVVPAGEGQTTRSHQVAGAGSRSLAGFLDLVFQTLSFAVFAWLALTYRPQLFPPESWKWAAPLGFIEWHIIYLMLMESFSGGLTPGKAIVGLRVVSTQGTPPTPFKSVLRNLGRVGDLVLFGYLVSLYMISMHSARQRMGDKLAGTLVVYNKPLAWQLEHSHVPESLYSTSEDGYLLESWIHREKALDPRARLTSAADLAGYLHARYEPNAPPAADPVAYLHQLYTHEKNG